MLVTTLYNYNECNGKYEYSKYVDYVLVSHKTGYKKHKDKTIDNKENNEERKCNKKCMNECSNNKKSSMPNENESLRDIIKSVINEMSLEEDVKILNKYKQKNRNKVLLEDFNYKDIDKNLMDVLSIVFKILKH